MLSFPLLALPGGRPPQYSDLEALQYTTQAVKEVLRLYPAIPIFPREAASADRLPSGHRVDAGEPSLVNKFSESVWHRVR